jgi:hypothetical protein
MSAVVLCCWNLRRLFRARALLLAAIALPAVGSLVCGEWFADSPTAKAVGFALMAAYAAALVSWQAIGDSTRGLGALLRSLRVPGWTAECAALCAFAVILVLEVVVFVGIRAIVH